MLFRGERGGGGGGIFSNALNLGAFGVKIHNYALLLDLRALFSL